MPEPRWHDLGAGVVGPLLAFFGELGVLFPQFPFIAHSPGLVGGGHGEQCALGGAERRPSTGGEALADGAVRMAADIHDLEFTHEQVARGGRKAHHLA